MGRSTKRCKVRGRRVGVLVALLSLACWGQASADANAPAVAGYRLGAGDLLELHVFEAPELATTARLDEAGKFPLPVVGALSLAGLTLDAARQAIAGSLRGRYLLQPTVEVLVREYAAYPVTVLGAVRHPGIYMLRGQNDLLSVLAMAGGVLAESGDEVVITPDGGGPTRRLALVGLTRAGTPEDPSLAPHDVVRVMPVAAIYVGGEVHKPGQFALPAGGLTLLQALSMAGGVNARAVQHATRLVHTDVGGRRTVERLDLGGMLRGTVADVALRPNDLLYVPSAVGRTALLRGLETALAAGTTIVTGLIVFH
ncbi:MAG: polysaccharide biosynthesis/export family protein [Terriglobales bacterium]